MVNRGAAQPCKLDLENAHEMISLEVRVEHEGKSGDRSNLSSHGGGR
jgi:hypothetical protein